MGQWREEGADILLQHQARFVLNSALVTDAYMALCLSVCHKSVFCQNG